MKERLKRISIDDNITFKYNRKTLNFNQSIPRSIGSFLCFGGFVFGMKKIVLYLATSIFLLSFI